LDSERITVEISASFAEKLDEIAQRLGYTSRDEVVEEAVKRFLEGFESLGELDGEYS